MSQQNRWRSIYTIENAFEADMIRDALDKEGILYRISEHRDTAYDGLFILQKGFASLFVEEINIDHAMAIVNRIKSLPYVVYSKD